MPSQLNVSVDLTNQKLGFSGTAGANPAISIDYIPPLGDGKGYTALELFLISLASCSASAVILILRKMGKTVTALKVNAQGLRRDVHPTCFETIDLTFVVHAKNTTAAEVQKAIALSEENICPVWAMIKGNVAVHTAIEIMSA
jgi:putative redox protein